jgi:tRNA dimethylallyltransferase
MLQKLIVILGPTAVGKTKFAVELASKFNGEIISADSRQVYKGMDIGTGKDLDEYQIGNSKVPYHLIDIISPNDEYNLFSFQNDFYSAYSKIYESGNQPFLVGGTGLYIHSILNKYKLNLVDFKSERGKELDGLSENELLGILNKVRTEFHNTTDSVSKERIIKAILVAEGDKTERENRPKFNSLVIGISESRDVIKERITNRLKYRLQNGMIEEVETLIQQGVDHSKLDFFGLEYRLIGAYIKGELSYNDMYQKLNSAIHKFAKRQMTWFRKMEKEGVKINWLKFEEIENAKVLITNFLDGVDE